ncbi:hypothetical protein LJ753_07730 [Arthrobacter sp. zg-Y20]|uniref:hypothetical protein n=1 Tax=unclassified Arthrobacter TaxID=235627 RepID=UPI001D1477AB|nr:MULTISPECIES: hypothetical protein [unclassified Arthrobacter]MCC3275758.1 hypothetical protein [Arthrobacter sp. zg-Y20]MDK1315915.1 hypothetical protein [Arthrobacter sp. zg.Y20]WIB06306.1 hypothetical protein QNO06_00695 [Arthrobacter sp. zg-Y20]
MSIATAFQVGALAVSGLFALTRLPSAVKGRNPLLFWALLMLCIAIALGISPVYLAVDNALGGVNIANVIIRFAMYGFFLILGVKAAVAFRAPGAGRLIAGPAGVAVVIAVGIATVVLFILADLPVSSPGLRSYGGQLPVMLYGMLGRVYPGYVAACLVGPALRIAAHRRRPSLMRAGAGLLGVGLIGVVLYAIQDVTPLDVNPWDHLVPYSSIILTTVGLALLGSQRIASKKRIKQTPLMQTYVK